MRLTQIAVAAACGLMLATPIAWSPIAAAQTTPTTAMPAKPMAPMAPMTAKPAMPMAAPSAAMAPKAALVNINTATSAELDALPQIGKVRTAAIIKGRPYKTTDDLVTKKVLTKGIFEKIKDSITAG